MAKIPVIKTVNLTKEFELGVVNVQALQGVNLEIYSGEFIVFFGPSGCGKSTLMSMIAGLQPPSSGKILIRGEDLAQANQEQLAEHRRSKIGMVFQAFNLISTMNIVENIALPLAFARIDKKRRMARAENLLDVVGMGEYKKHTPSELSGGQQQRIAIARSLVANPWIMLADEPTGNLDSKAANEVMRLLISLNRKSKRTVVLITHNPDYLDYADRIFYIRDGKVVDTKVNSKVKQMDESEIATKIRDDLVPKEGDYKKKSEKAKAENAAETAPEATVPQEVEEAPAVTEEESIPKTEAETVDEAPQDEATEELAEAPQSKPAKKSKLKPMKLGK